MQTDQLVAKPKARFARLLRFGWRAVFVLLGLLVIAQLIWTYSGSNQWEFAGEKKGVKLYTLKQPGTDLLQFRGVVRVHSTLARLVAMMQDLEACRDVGCYEAKMVERVDDRLQYYSFRWNLPFPFHPREYVVRGEFHQNPQTGEVLADFVAAPEKTPPNPCCVRVTDMNNTWRFTPLENGEIELEYRIKTNEGGYLPHALLNMGRPEAVFAILPEMERWLDRDKYREARFEFIKEKH